MRSRHRTLRILAGNPGVTPSHGKKHVILIVLIVFVIALSGLVVALYLSYSPPFQAFENPPQKFEIIYSGAVGQTAYLWGMNTGSVEITSFSVSQLGNPIPLPCEGCLLPLPVKGQTVIKVTFSENGSQTFTVTAYAAVHGAYGQETNVTSRNLVVIPYGNNSGSWRQMLVAFKNSNKSSIASLRIRITLGQFTNESFASTMTIPGGLATGQIFTAETSSVPCPNPSSLCNGESELPINPWLSGVQVSVEALDSHQNVVSDSEFIL